MKNQDLVALRKKPHTVTDDYFKELTVSISEVYLTICIEDRCYYFNTDTGKFDGSSTDHTKHITIPKRKGL